MFRIQTSFSDCQNCSLYNSPSALCDTNCQEDLRKTQVLFVAENPGKDEVKGGNCLNEEYSAGTPLIGDAGKVFRQPFNEIRDKINYFITNVVLCATIQNGKTKNPSNTEIHRCKTNLFTFIEYCNPDLIVSMGTTPMKVLTGMESGITKNNGQISYFNGYPVLILVHPSYVNRNGGIESDSGKEFSKNIKDIPNILNNFNNNKKEENISEDNVMSHVTEDEFVTQDPIEIQKDNNVLKYQIPEYFYSDNYRLIDVQKNSKDNQLVFIFRDSDNNKIFYNPDLSQINYYWYEGSENKIIDSYNNLKPRSGDFNKRPRNSKNNYESDLSLLYKHSVDYYLQTEGEASVSKRNVLFFDIEVYTFDDRIFPAASDAEYPISSISFQLDDGKTETYLYQIDDEIDNNIEEIKSEYENLTIFTSERQMILDFIQKIHNLKPDYFAGWNTRKFDWPYIYNRMRQLRLDPQNLSPFRNVYIDLSREEVDITGYINLDQMWIYQNLTYTNEPSYSLEAISQKILKEGKKEYNGNLNNLYKNDMRTFLDYGIQDVVLLKRIDDSLSHIALQDEIRRVACATHKASETTLGLVDCLMYYHLKSQNLTSKTSEWTKNSKTIEGAYVREPVGGYYDWVIDFDYKSLYPSIIYSFNLGPDTYIAKISEEDAFNYIYKNQVSDSIEISVDPARFGKTKTISGNDFRKLISENYANISCSGCIFYGKEIKESVMSSLIGDLFNKRKTYKKKMGEERNNENFEIAKIYENYQQSYKTFLNSLYGVMAQEHFRFFNLDLASTITKSGQELIRFAGDHVDNYMKTGRDPDLNLNFWASVDQYRDYLLYVDTDSLFLWMEPYLKSMDMEINSENILNESQKIQDYLNDNLLRKFDRYHNVDSKDSMFELENELVIKRYYTIGMKKKYASYILLENGSTPEDDIDVKGLEIKRSDFSQFTKDMLSDILNMILKTEKVDSDRIFEYVDQRRNEAYEIMENHRPDICKMVSFARPLNQYKSMPQHIKGMLIWNNLEYDYFRPGMRGYLFPIQGIDVSNAPEQIQKNYMECALKEYGIKDINCIVVPEEQEILPPYYHINKNALIKFSLEDRVEFLLKPLMLNDKEDILTW